MDDYQVADIINKEQKRLQCSVGTHGVTSYLMRQQTRKDVNKVFLANTIRSVDSHNQKLKTFVGGSSMETVKMRSIISRPDQLSGGGGAGTGAGSVEAEVKAERIAEEAEVKAEVEAK
ncbi:unnamed protein product [Albugo candida]|uniref:Uncharacterized protein n=1 Tax=Albugo candida TaxID=65357 RepID=A0A024GCH0_9STRA|nr:unnamed protein product [Albugo candida]|eukprot:CCI44240.1 unnamed protein product [Albugo candida]